MDPNNAQLERKVSFQNMSDSRLSLRFVRTASKYCVACCVFVSAVFTLLNFTQSIQYDHIEQGPLRTNFTDHIFSTRKAHPQQQSRRQTQEFFGSTIEERLAKVTFAHVEHPDNISIAICYKTIFGSFSLEKAQVWMHYYRALGVDHFYFWYLPDWPVTQSTAWTDFIALPYVTTTPYMGRISKVNSTRGTHYGQNQVEQECLREHAQNYTWALPLDVDEYLWMSRNQTLKEFLWEHQEYNSISFGKYMHVFDHQVPVSSSIESSKSTITSIRNPQTGLFGLEVYSYTAGSFCVSVTGLPRCPKKQCYPGGTQCPSWKGRSKVLVRPQIHHEVYQHGYLNPLVEPHAPQNQGVMLVPTTQGHWKEWNEFFTPRSSPAEIHVDQIDIIAPENLHLHNFPGGYAKNSNGSVTLFHDDHWAPWLHYVEDLHSISVQDQ